MLDFLGSLPSCGQIFELKKKAIQIMAGLGSREDCKQAFKIFNLLTLPSHYILENLLYVKDNEDKFRVYSGVHSHSCDTR